MSVQESADEGEISFETERGLKTSHFSLMFHSGSNCALKVKIFVSTLETVTD